MYNPKAIPIPTDAATQIIAALVNPEECPVFTSRTMKPAPRNPTPVTMAADILVGSILVEREVRT